MCSHWASVGIYSVLSYIVRGRSREIGIRTALGAQSTDVLRLIVREGMTPALIGIAAGAAASLASATVLNRLVFGVSASDAASMQGTDSKGCVAFLSGCPWALSLALSREP